MPLSWILSNLMLLVILFVVFLVYSMSYYNLSILGGLGSKTQFSVVLCW